MIYDPFNDIVVCLIIIFIHALAREMRLSGDVIVVLVAIGV